MEYNRWKQIKEILAKAFEKEPAERENFILSACEGDSNLQKELESYLELYKEEDSFLEVPIAKLSKESISVMLRANAQIGPYTLIKQIGKGAFGVVWLAEKRTSIATSQVAIKIALEEEPDLEAIKQEASLWAQIGGHPNVLPMIEANIYDDQVVIVSEYAPDGSLESWMKKRGGSVPSVEIAVAIISGVLSGLEHLHSKKVLHRDLKPANILLQGETPRLADFGLSRILKTTSNSTNASGTPAYMAPESFDGKKVAQTDIWAAGVIFYQLLTGNFPFPAKEYSVLIGAIFTKDPDPLPDNLKQFQAVISKALEKKPENRYQSANEMKVAVQSCLMVGQPTVKVESKVKPAPDVEIGPYTLIKRLGQGAFGEVWLAEKRTAISKTKVAIKLSLDEEPDLETIKKEVDIWAHIGNHPNVLPMIEADIYGEHILIVSEYAPDGSLEDWLKKHGGKAPTVKEAIEITKGILSGLEHLHSRKVLHRDLKPANILLQGEIPRLADFGVARILKTSQHSSGIAGTPAYMSPEAFNGERLEQTDIWAVGIILYQLLVGRLPFSKQNIGALIAAIAMEPPQSLPDEFRKEIQQIISQALEKDPKQRYQSAKEMRAALGAILNNFSTASQTEIIDEHPKSVHPRTEITAHSINQEIELDTDKINVSETAKPNLEPATLAQTEIIKTIPEKPLLLPEDYITIKDTEIMPTVSPSHPERGASRQKRMLVSIILVVIFLGISYSVYKTAIVNQRRALDLGEFTMIPTGEFMMGSDKNDNDEKPVHKVTIGTKFEIAKTEVTQAQWQAVMGNNPSIFKGENLPVENVSWGEVLEFIQNINDASKNYRYRLPTEAEWEYAAKAGTISDYAGNLDEMAWYGENFSQGSTHPVGQKKPNAWGLYDMHGNVSEWCLDTWHDSYQESPSDGSAWISEFPSSQERVLRGGSWNSYSRLCRSAYRGWLAPSKSYSFVGFRIVRVAK